MNQWNGLDFFMFLILFLNLIHGMSRGASKEIISMMCLSVALIFTIKFTVPLTAYLNSSPLTQSVLSAQVIQNFMGAIGAGPLTAGMLRELSYCLSIAICFAGIFCACEAMLAVAGFVEVFSWPYAALNRKVGAALGLTRGYVIVVIFILILSHIYPPGRSGSYFVYLLRGTAARLDRLIAGQDVEKYQNIYEDIYKNKSLYKSEDILNLVPKRDQQIPTPPSNP
jgi:uncharacterized membrane protein required for colicin V production